MGHYTRIFSGLAPEVRAAILAIIEHRHGTHPALRNVMRHAWDDCTR